MSDLSGIKREVQPSVLYLIMHELRVDLFYTYRSNDLFYTNRLNDLLYTNRLNDLFYTNRLNDLFHTHLVTLWFTKEFSA